MIFILSRSHQSAKLFARDLGYEPNQWCHLDRSDRLIGARRGCTVLIDVGSEPQMDFELIGMLKNRQCIVKDVSAWLL